ncbi:MAG: response regulator transcription factor, partial [Polaromonas sp.]|nr:response regulator transcription factor [Polaromonas sp.]
MQSSPTPPLIHVALVEDDVHFQNAIVTAIAASPDIRLMSLASTRAQGLQSLQSAPADVLLVDLGLPDGSGIDVIHAAHAQWPTCAVMVCTAFGDEAHVLQSIEAGASGYLLKDSEPENMLHEIRSLHGGGSPISPLIARQILMRFRAAPAPAPASAAVAPAIPAAAPAPTASEQAVLSAREKEVLELITKGFTADEIARLMQVSQHT